MSAIVLAAGASRRMAPRHKLLLRGQDGQTMVGRVVRACCASAIGEVVVVLGHAAAAVEQAVCEASRDRRVRSVFAADHAAGLSASLRAGLAARSPDSGAALICLADMPLVRADVIRRIVGAHDEAAGRLIVVPCHAGQRGNPVLWDRRFLADMSCLSGDAGARSLLGRHAAWVWEIEAGQTILQDFDTPDDLASL